MKKQRMMISLGLTFLIVLFHITTVVAEPQVLGPGFDWALLADGLSNPQDITSAQPGGPYGNHIFVTEYGANRVTKIATDGAKVPFATGVPYAVAILFGSSDFGQHLYVSESYSSNGNIVKLLPDGQKITFAENIASPLDMVWGPGGDFGSDLYVASANDNKIIKVAASGQYTDFVTALDRPSVLAFSPSQAFGNYLYASNTSNGQIIRISPAGVVETFVDQLDHPVGLAFGHNTPFGDYLFVGESHTGEILAITPSGAVSTFAKGFQEPVELHFFQGGAYANDMLIADGDGGKIYRIFSPNAIQITLLPLSADVGADPFTLSFTLEASAGLNILSSFAFLYNGIDVTDPLLPYLAACITEFTATRLTIQCPGLAFPPGVHTIEIRVGDIYGRISTARAIYTVPGT